MNRIYPWFEFGAPTFSKNKLTRKPNPCVVCSVEMLDVGHTQIIYVCVNPDCQRCHEQFFEMLVDANLPLLYLDKLNFDETMKRVYGQEAA